MRSEGRPGSVGKGLGQYDLERRRLRSGLLNQCGEALPTFFIPLGHAAAFQQRHKTFVMEQF